MERTCSIFTQKSAFGPISKLKNKDAQTLLNEYIKRTGKKPESDGAIAEAISRQIDFEIRECERRKLENQTLGERLKIEETQLGELERKIKYVKERRDELDEKYKGDPARGSEEIKKFLLEENKKDEKVLTAIRDREADDSAIKREITEARKEAASVNQVDLDVSGLEKPNELTKLYNAKANEQAKTMLVAGNVLTNSRNGPVPGPEMN